MDWMAIPGREAPPYKSVVGKEATRDQALVANMATAPPTPETTTPPIPRPTLVLNFTERCPRGCESRRREKAGPEIASVTQYLGRTDVPAVNRNARKREPATSYGGRRCPDTDVTGSATKAWSECPGGGAVIRHGLDGHPKPRITRGQFQSR